jgi:hypothetical protein
VRPVWGASTRVWGEIVRPGWDEQGDPTAAPHPPHAAPSAADPPAAPDAQAPPADGTDPGPAAPGPTPGPTPGPAAPGPASGPHPTAAATTATPPGPRPQPSAPAQPPYPGSNGYAPNGSAPSGIGLPAYTGPYPASGEYPDIPAGWRRGALPPSPWPVTGREVVGGIVTVLALAVAGILSAYVWLHVAPRLAFQITQDGAAPLRPEEEQFFATDAWFMLLTLVWGLIAAVALWWLPRLRGPAAVATLAVGGVVGAIVTWRMGLVLGPAPTKAATEVVGNVVYPPLRLRALPALTIEPLVAVGLYLLLAGFSDGDLGRTDSTEVPAARQPSEWIPPG